jgi:hypothetical protein
MVLPSSSLGGIYTPMMLRLQFPDTIVAAITFGPNGFTPSMVCVCVRHGETSLKRRKTETESEYGWRWTPSSVQRQLKSLPMDE